MKIRVSGGMCGVLFTWGWLLFFVGLGEKERGGKWKRFMEGVFWGVGDGVNLGGVI